MYQIHTSHNNLNDEEMIKSHLMCVVKTIKLCLGEKNNRKKPLVKHVT